MSPIAEFYSRNLSSEVLKGLSQKAKNGGTNYRAPLGYKSQRTIDELGREDGYVIIDEERAPLITLAFKYYATGDWSLNASAQYLAAFGLASRATPKIPSKLMDKGMLSKNLANPYYKGYVYFQGAIYPYFVCIGRAHKQTDCTMKAVLIDDVEREIEKLYERTSISTELKTYLETWLNQYIKERIDEFEAERSSLEREKDKLERKRVKLLEAHYADAIPLELLRTEQGNINRVLLDIDELIKSHDTHYEVISNNLKLALNLIENCGQAYRNAPESIKRAFNQAIFEKILVYSNDKLEPVFAPPFDILLDLAKPEIMCDKFFERRNTTLENGGSGQLKNPVQSVFLNRV